MAKMPQSRTMCLKCVIPITWLRIVLFERNHPRRGMQNSIEFLRTQTPTHVIQAQSKQPETYNEFSDTDP